MHALEGAGRALALLAALTVPLAVACGPSSHSSGDAGSTLALHGAFVPSTPASSAEYASLTFLSATTFTALRAGCGGSPACRAGGTYVYDGASDLALTDGATRKTEHLSIAPLATSTAPGEMPTAPDAGLAAKALHPLDLVTALDGGSTLVSASSSPLLPTLTAASVGGAPMTHLEEDDPAPVSSSPLLVPLTSKPGAVTVTLQVGRHGTPIEAVLDTGSSGIWIASSALDPRDGIDQQATATTTYGAAQQLTGEVKSAFVTLGSTRSIGALPIGVVTSATCINGASCDDGTINGIDQITLAGSSLHAIVGIGMDRRPVHDGIVSPFGAMGQQSEQCVLSVGSVGNLNARLIIDPAATDLADFALTSLSGSRASGYAANTVPFCISGDCVQGLLDSGESEAFLQSSGDAATLAQLEQTDAPTTAARGLQLVDPVELSVLGVADVPSAMPTGVAGSLVQLRPDAVGNNLGILAFRGLDVFSDAWNGSIGARPLTGELVIGGSSGTSATVPSSIIAVNVAWSPTATKVVVPLSIGGSPPIPATVDTGSTGIRILASAVPAGAWQVSTTALPDDEYGGTIVAHGVAALAAVQLDGIPLPEMVTVEDVTSIRCTAEHPQCGATGNDFGNGYAAIVGIGMRATGGLASPLVALSKTGVYELALPPVGSTEPGALLVDPPPAQLARFTALTQLPSLPAGTAGALAWDDTKVPFCVNQFCGQGIVDSGGDRATLSVADDSQLADLGVQPGAKTFPSGTLVTQTIGSSVSWTFTVSDMPASGVDLFVFSSAITQVNNLGPAPFYVNDALYDYAQGTIGFVPKP